MPKIVIRYYYTFCAIKELHNCPLIYDDILEIEYI